MSDRRRPWALALATALLSPAAVLTAFVSSATPANAATLDPSVLKALDSPYVTKSELIGDPKGVAVLDKSLYGLPTEGGSAMILSTGDASLVADPVKAAKQPKTKKKDLVGTDLRGAGSADKNDLTQVKLTLAPPNGNQGCMAFDFMFFSEEFPNYTGAAYNDIFTAELNRTEFSLQGRQVLAPNNFAYSEDKEVLSVNTFTKFTAAPKSGLNGRSGLYTAVSKLEWPDAEQNPITLYLSVQDLGDSKLDSAVVVDKLRFFQSDDCAKGIVPIVDTDGDGLSDEWETKGVDYDGDGKPELDLKALGADPRHKDIFLEIDWMAEDPSCTTTKLVCSAARNKVPQQEALNKVIEAFADAPVSNPDGKTGVTVHIDAGPNTIKDPASGALWGKQSGGNAVPFAETTGKETGDIYDWSDFDKIKAKNFDVSRADVFHYTLYVNKHGNSGSSGRSRGLPGSDLLLSDATFGSGRFSVLEEAGTLMHELGHNLSLAHAGDSGLPLYRKGYYSIMNYSFQFKGVDLNGKLDYSRGNRSYDPSDPSFVKFDDWSHIVFTGGSIGDLGATAPLPTTTATEEITADEAKKMGVLGADGDGTVALLGPTLVAKGIDQQVLIADVTNIGGKDSEYTIKLTSAWGSAKPVTITVPAGKTLRVELPIAVAKAELDSPSTVQLYRGDTLLSSSSLSVNAVDLSDDETAEQVEKTVEEVKTAPPAGLDPDVTKQLTTTMDTKTNPQAAQQAAQPDTGNQGGFPVLLVVAIAVGVALVATVIIVVTRRGRTKPVRRA